MKLYTFEHAPNPQRFELFLKHKGIELETVSVDLGTNEQLGDAYRAINPRCTVPALELDDGSVMADIIGMCIYLEDQYSDKPLLGNSKRELADIVAWDQRIVMEGMLSIAHILRNGNKNFANRALPGPVDMPQIPELVERGKLGIHAFWEMLNAHLEARDFIVGTQLSFADIDAYVLINFSAWVKEQPPADYTRLLTWHTRIGELLSGTA